MSTYQLRQSRYCYFNIDFPRKISTKTTEGRKIFVDDKPQALARFKQANYLDCRISAYTELDDSPNFLFVDIDIKNDLKQVLKSISRFKAINAKPTVLYIEILDIRFMGNMNIEEATFYFSFFVLIILPTKQ